MKGERVRSTFRRAALALALSSALIVGGTTALAGKSFEGRWTFTVTIPVAAGSSQKQTLTLDIDALPRDGSLHGRMMITDAQSRTVGGVWRQSGKKVSIIYELPCSEGEECASLLLTGKMKSSNTLIKKGNVIVMWDGQDDRNPALYHTSNGTFSAARLP